MKKVLIGISIILLSVFWIVVITAVVKVQLNPLNRSNDKIRESILEMTPIGTSMSDVREFIINNEEWEMSEVHNHGILMGEIGKTGDPIGTQSITTRIGKYTKLWEISVKAYWAFDKNSELIEVRVVRYGGF